MINIFHDIRAMTVRCFNETIKWYDYDNMVSMTIWQHYRNNIIVLPVIWFECLLSEWIESLLYFDNVEKEKEIKGKQWRKLQVKRQQVETYATHEHAKWKIPQMHFTTLRQILNTSTYPWLCKIYEKQYVCTWISVSAYLHVWFS